MTRLIPSVRQLALSGGELPHRSVWPITLNVCELASPLGVASLSKWDELPHRWLWQLGLKADLGTYRHFDNRTPITSQTLFHLIYDFTMTLNRSIALYFNLNHTKYGFEFEFHMESDIKVNSNCGTHFDWKLDWSF